MGAYKFLVNGRRNPTPVFFDHGTETSAKAIKFLKSFDNLIIGSITNPARPKGISWEEHWRNERYSFLHSIEGPVVTGHNLGDAVETWIWGCLHGVPQIMPYNNRNVIRPFLLTNKTDLLQWAGSDWLLDEGNDDISFTRNRIRHNIMPEALKVNPGIAKVIKRKLLERSDAWSIHVRT